MNAVSENDLAEFGVQAGAVDVQRAQLDIKRWTSKPFAGDVVPGGSIAQLQDHMAFVSRDAFGDEALHGQTESRE